MAVSKHFYLPVLIVCTLALYKANAFWFTQQGLTSASGLIVLLGKLCTGMLFSFAPLTVWCDSIYRKCVRMSLSLSFLNKWRSFVYFWRLQVSYYADLLAWIVSCVWMWDGHMHSTLVLAKCGLGSFYRDQRISDRCRRAYHCLDNCFASHCKDWFSQVDWYVQSFGAYDLRLFDSSLFDWQYDIRSFLHSIHVRTSAKIFLHAVTYRAFRSTDNYLCHIVFDYGTSAPPCYGL